VSHRTWSWRRVLKTRSSTVCPNRSKRKEPFEWRSIYFGESEKYKGKIQPCPTKRMLSITAVWAVNVRKWKDKIGLLVVEQDLVVAGTWVKCAGVSRQGTSLMRIAVSIWNDRVSPLLDTTSKLQQQMDTPCALARLLSERANKNKFWFHKSNPIDLEVTHEPCNIAFVQALCCNHATIKGTPEFIKSNSIPNYILISIG